jgi:hypothetical protein
MADATECANFGLVAQRRLSNIEMQFHQAWPVYDAEEREGGVADVQVEFAGAGAAESHRSRAVQSISGRQQCCDRAIRSAFITNIKSKGA